MKIILIFILSFCVSTTYAIQKTIGIFTFKLNECKPWDPESVKKGVTGSEEAVIYIGEKLADLGYKVTVIGDPPQNSIHSLPKANPRYIPMEHYNGSVFDIGITWRVPQVGEELRKYAHKVYFWPHDTCNFYLSNSQINSFDGVLWLSEWQRQQWIAVNPAFNKFNRIFGNGINPDQFTPVKERSNPYSCIYGSNYARGLEILLEIWPIIKFRFPKATLDIYYGWQHWGLISPEKEKKMRERLAEISSMGVTDHGLVSHKELNDAYARASFWTYPCIAPETFCITALRAQLAGGIPVILEGSALKETVRHGYKCSKHQDYLMTLINAMQNAEKIELNQRKKMGEFVLQEYTWKAIAIKWKELFENQSSYKGIGVENSNLKTAGPGCF